MTSHISAMTPMQQAVDTVIDYFEFAAMRVAKGHGGGTERLQGVRAAGYILGMERGGGFRSANVRHRTGTPMTGGTLEHVVPVGVVRDAMLATDLSPAAVEDVLTRLLVVAYVTKEEDASLRLAGLAKCMPADWDGIDVWARYRAVGIDPSAFV